VSVVSRVRLSVGSNDLSLLVPPLPQHGQRDRFPSSSESLHGIVLLNSIGGRSGRSDIDYGVLEGLEVGSEVGRERGRSRGSSREGEGLDRGEVSVLRGRRSLVGFELFDVEVLDEVWVGGRDREDGRGREGGEGGRREGGEEEGDGR